MRWGRSGALVVVVSALLVAIVPAPSARADQTNAAEFLAVLPEASAAFGVVSTYRVQDGDSLSGIADLLAVDVDTMVDLNGLANPNAIRAGDVLVVPDMPTRPVHFGVAPKAARLNADAPSLIWPAIGPITTAFGVPGADWIGGFHMGLDIGAPAGAPIVAAAGGKVEAAEPDRAHGYGNYVLLDHGNGYETLYAHMSQIVATPGQQVDQGTLLGYVGQTGYAFGAHLHFEVRHNTAKIDPQPLLP